MGNLSLSDKYGIAAALGLIVMVATNNPIVMLAISLLGIVAGYWVVRRGEVRRVAFVALAAFVVTAMFAVFGLLRGG